MERESNREREREREVPQTHHYNKLRCSTRQRAQFRSTCTHALGVESKITSFLCERRASLPCFGSCGTSMGITRHGVALQPTHLIIWSWKVDFSPTTKARGCPRMHQRLSGAIESYNYLALFHHDSVQFATAASNNYTQNESSGCCNLEQLHPII